MATEKTIMTTPMIPVGWGEVFDKITILEIKQRKISDTNALRNVMNELEALKKVVDELGPGAEEVAGLRQNLAKINAELWDVEDRLREFEATRNFCEDFVQDARAVYRLNDERASIKKRINVACRSTISEEKSYVKLR